jgi:glycerol-3-phosphate dehydrogenase
MSNDDTTCEDKRYQQLLVAMSNATKVLAQSHQNFQTIKDLEFSKNMALAVLYLVSADQILNPTDLTLNDQKMQLNQAIYLIQQQIKKIEDMNDASSISQNTL